MKENRFEILIPHGLSQELEKICCATAPTVRKALRFDNSTSLKSHEIRVAALQNGGVLRGAATLAEAEEAIKCPYALIEKPVKVLDSKGHVMRVINE